ncbi:MAG: YihY/virulence factor BrkB family protein [Betaproteobacteria bacterium]
MRWRWHIPRRAAAILKNPLAFSLQVLKAFQANQGLLLAGAVAYYALLSIVPLLILMVMALSHFIDQSVLLATLRRALEFVVPGQSREVVQELRAFLDNGAKIGWVLLITMLFFSSLAFKVLENAMSVIFLHRVAERRRSIAVSLVLPFGYIVFLGALLFIGTYVLADLLAIGELNIVLEGHTWSLGAFSSAALYLAGMTGEILLISSIYYFMPIGRISVSHALIGGATAGVLWEIIRHGLVWYFGTLSQVNLVYGSLATAIIVLLSFEIVATLLLFGAQVIAEYERLGPVDSHAPPVAAQLGEETEEIVKPLSP